MNGIDTKSPYELLIVGDKQYVPKEQYDALQHALSLASRALKFVNGPKHEGQCAYTDKVDEGCYLCREAENNNWHIVTEALAHPLIQEVLKCNQ